MIHINALNYSPPSFPFTPSHPLPPATSTLPHPHSPTQPPSLAAPSYESPLCNSVGDFETYDEEDRPATLSAQPSSHDTSAAEALAFNRRPSGVPRFAHRFGPKFHSTVFWYLPHPLDPSNLSRLEEVTFSSGSVCLPLRSDLLLYTVILICPPLTTSLCS